MLPVIEANGTLTVFASTWVVPAPAPSVWLGSVMRTFAPLREIVRVSAVVPPLASVMTRLPPDNTTVVSGAGPTVSVNEASVVKPQLSVASIVIVWGPAGCALVMETTPPESTVGAVVNP